MPHAIGAKSAQIAPFLARELRPVAINLRVFVTTVLGGPRGAAGPRAQHAEGGLSDAGRRRGAAQSQPLSWYHLAVRWTPSLKRTSGFQPRSSCVFVLSQTQWCLSIATFSRVSITALPRTLP
jgi:hypothetical protein